MYAVASLRLSLAEDFPRCSRYLMLCFGLYLLHGRRPSAGLPLRYGRAFAMIPGRATLNTQDRDKTDTVAARSPFDDHGVQAVIVQAQRAGHA